jgi:MtaA/CmuA family methyltransferase
MYNTKKPMTGKERISNFIKNEQTDSLPAMPITMMLAGDFIGVPYGRYAADYRLHAKGQAAVADYYDLDYVSAISDPGVEAHDWGADIVFYEDQPPAVDERSALLAEKKDLARLTPPDPAAGKRMSNRVQVVEELKRLCGQEKIVEGWIEGPAAEASDLRGINHVMLDLMDDPSFIRELFEAVAEVAIEFAVAQLKAGADIIGMGDAAASLVGPQLYEDLVWDYEKRIVDAIHDAGGMVRLHICGRTGPICSGMARLGCEIVDLDALAPMGPGRADSGPDQVLLGNIDPVRVLRDGSPADVWREIGRCWTDAGPRLIIGAGCEVPRDTPEENLKTLVRFAREHTAR